MNDKLTAYALNELPPDDRAALEQQMATDPALREEAEAMKAFCGILKEHVGQFPPPEEEELTGDQRSQVLKAFLNTPRKIARPPFWKRAEFISTAIAAGLALTLLVPTGVLIERRETLSETAARSQATEEITVTRAEPVGRDLAASVMKKKRVTTAEALVLEMDSEPLGTSDQRLDRTEAKSDGQKPLFGDAPASTMPLPLPAPITSPAAPPAIAPNPAPAPAQQPRLRAIEGYVERSGAGVYDDKNMATAASGTPHEQKAKENKPAPSNKAQAESSVPLTTAGRRVYAPEAAEPMKRESQKAAESAPLDAAGMPTSSSLSATRSSTAGVSAESFPISPSTPAGLGENMPAVGLTPAPVSSLKDGPNTQPAAGAAGMTGSLAVSDPMSQAAPQGAAAAPAAVAGSTATLGDGIAPIPTPKKPATREGEHGYANTDYALRRKVEIKDIDADGSTTDKDGADRTRDSFYLQQKKPSSAGESYTPIYENPFTAVAQEPLSTFSIDVDTASYANVRRFLNNGQRPPADAVRLEELINYFPYAYEGPADDKPFAVQVDVAETPWKPEHRLARIAIKGRVNPQERAPANFVFLVDVSGSMDEPDKLPLVKQSLRMLTERLSLKDRVAIVTYAGSTAVTLPSTAGTEKSKIIEAIDGLGAAGSTNGAGGIRLAYEEATQNFLKEGVNRVILCTDGDFNVGISSPEELQKLIEEKAKSRVFLSVLGFGTGNLKDRTMETLADKGNGNYAYIDSLSEARKVLVEQMNATLVTIAKDVKIQVEFNPAQVQAYRLLGYENRVLAKQDFNNDRKDAGEIGEGHTVTALYEIVPAHVKLPDGRPLVDELKYAARPTAPAAPAAPAAAPAEAAKAAPASHETMTVKLRYKQPLADTSVLMEVPVTDKEKKMADAPGDFKFAASVAGFGMLLRNSQHAGELTWDQVRQLALAGKGPDDLGYRGEFLQLIDKARGIVTDRPQ